MPFDPRRLRQCLLHIESEILSQEAATLERDRVNLDLRVALAKRDERIEVLETALTDTQDRASEPHCVPATFLNGPVDEVWRSKPLAGKLELCLAMLDGWCTPQKAEWLTRFIIDRQMTSAIEIGIFGGKSLVPITLALQETGGFAVGVEPWSNQTAVAEFTSETNDVWWSTVDLAQIKTRFFAHAARFDALRNLRILEMDSDQAFSFFEQCGDAQFDLVHIDGAHSPERALKDAKNWSSLVRKGGIVAFDDIGWPSVAAARTYLTSHFTVIDEVFEESQGTSYGAYEV